MGPFLESYMKGEPIGASLVNFLKENPDHQLAQAMKKVRDSIPNKSLFEEAITFAKQIDYQQYAVEEQLILLQILCHAYSANNRVQNAYSILSNVKRLITPNMAPEFLILPISLESAIQSKEGNNQHQSESMEKCLEILGTKSGHYKLILWIYLMQLCKTNEYIKFETRFQEFSKLVKGTELANRIDFILLLKNFELGNFIAIKPLIEKLKSEIKYNFWDGTLILYEKAYELMVNNSGEKLDKNIEEDWLLFSLDSICKNKPEDALCWAHKYTNEQINYNLEQGLLSYYLIRAELANKNINAAAFILDSKFKKGNYCPFDDFFWFRIHHIKGDINNAQNYFNSILTYVESEKLDQRLDFELKFSTELSLTDLRHYTKKVNSKVHHKNKIKSNPNSYESSLDFLKGNSKAILKVKELIKAFTNVDTSVLILGETGTGKELVAKGLWQSGIYKNKPFIAINCGAISDQLLQSELFGHQKGAFTGAYQDHKGLFEEAGDGIIFMDEIGEISHNMQVSLLRILESKEYRPVGSTKNKKLNCKIIAATNRKLEDLVNQGTFRQDLQFRLERLIIEVPPLRERANDIPDLINHFLNDLNQNLRPIFFDDQTLEHLQSLNWQGNIRELRNEMERIRLFYSDKMILTINELSDKYKTSSSNLSKKKPDSSTNNIINLNSKFRRLEELKNLFVTHNRLTRLEIVNLLNVSPNTAASYLDALEKENYICKQNVPNTKTYFYKLI